MNLLSIMIMMSVLSMCWWRKSIILMLLSLELLIMSMFTTMMMMVSLASNSSLLIMLAMMVSGSSLGLSLLVSMSHLHNSSNSYYINLLTSDKNTITFLFCNSLHYNNQPPTFMYNHFNFNNLICYHKI